MKINIERTVFRPKAIIWIVLAFFLNQPLKVFAQNPEEEKVLLAIFAHPDDEMTVAPILAKYAREGVKVHLVITTDGRLGTNDFHDYEAGDALVVTRREEMKCAAELLGVSLTHLNFHDQLKAAEGYDGHVPHAREMIRQINDIVEEIQPDAIITWGPDGGSTHMDHRLVGASVTQLYLSEDREKPMDLFYYGTPSEHLEDSDAKLLRGQATKFLRTKVSYARADLERAFRALKCHYSQIDPMLTEDVYMERMLKNGPFIYLRKFEAPTKDSNSIFD